jgi:hypothetical protein
MLNNTYGIEIECYLPEGGTQAGAAAAITARLAGAGICQVENYNHQVRGHWKIVTDGSLGDYIRGMEVVSPILTGQEGLDAITKVMDAMADYGCTVSKKCGLHIHVGVAGQPIGFFRSLTKLYGGFERVIDAFIPPSRRGSTNGYCRSVTHLDAAQIDRADSLDDLIRLMRRAGDARNYKLNLTAYRRHTTVEFRHHTGTVDARKATAWAKLCLRMVEAAKAGRALGPASGGANQAKPGSKSHLIGQMMRRADGVSGREAMAAAGWPSVSLPQQARACGMAFTTRRFGREVRYYAVAATTTGIGATLDGLFEMLDCPADERDYFRARTAGLSGPTAWAA